MREHTVESFEAALERMRQVEGGNIREKDFAGWSEHSISSPPYRYAVLEVQCATEDAPRVAHDLAVLAIEIGGGMDMGTFTDSKHRWLSVRVSRPLTAEEIEAAGFEGVAS